MKLREVFCFTLFLVFFMSGALYSEDTKSLQEKVTGFGSAGVFNKYIFRGYEMSKNSVVIQPSLSATLKGFTVTFWGNIDTDQHRTQSVNPGTGEFKKGYNETDTTLSYTHNIGPLGITGGYIYYGTKNITETEEFFINLALEVFSKPTLTLYQDISEYTGTYINLGLSQSFKVYKDITLDLGASGSYFTGRNRYWQTYNQSKGSYTGSKYKGFHAGMLSAGLTIPITKSVNLQPIVQYWLPLSGDAKKTCGYDPATGDKISYNPNGYIRYNLVYGANVIYNF